MTFEEWIRSFDWLFQRDLPCIISADLDGIVCGLLQGSTLGWRTVGTYDGTVLNLYENPNSIDWTKAVFLDVEILRSEIRSLGNHLLALDSNDVLHLRETYPHCANPNLWRGINVRDSFQSKYPFSTLPLLLASTFVRDPNYNTERPWLALALHTDSSFTNAAVYQANALEWLERMGNCAGDALSRFCRLLEKIPAQTAIRMLHEVQQWAAEAGFGGKQRACRFDLRIAHERERASALMERVARETNVVTRLPLNVPPVHSEQFETRQLPIHTKGRQIASFNEARSLRVVSMAATGRTDLGLSITLPNPVSAISDLR